MGIHSPEDKSWGDMISARRVVPWRVLTRLLLFLSRSPLRTARTIRAARIPPLQPALALPGCRGAKQSLCVLRVQVNLERSLGHTFAVDSYVLCLRFDSSRVAHRESWQWIFWFGLPYRVGMSWVCWVVVLASAGNSFNPVSWTRWIWAGNCCDGNGGYDVISEALKLLFC